MNPDWNALLLAVIGLVGSGGVASIITALLNRHWKKKDEAEAKKSVTPEELENMKATLYAVADALKVSMAYDIRCAGASYVYAGEITLDGKETLERMYTAYMALPGADGLCGTVMDEVNKLDVVEQRTAPTH